MKPKIKDIKDRYIKGGRDSKMHLKIGDMELEVVKSWYNKSKVSDDGVTHIIDTEHQYTVFQVGMAKNYFDIETRDELIEVLVKDLRHAASTLEQQLNKDTERDVRDDGGR